MNHDPLLWFFVYTYMFTIIMHDWPFTCFENSIIGRRGGLGPLRRLRDIVLGVTRWFRDIKNIDTGYNASIYLNMEIQMFHFIAQVSENTREKRHVTSVCTEIPISTSSWMNPYASSAPPSFCFPRSDSGSIQLFSFWLFDCFSLLLILKAPSKSTNHTKAIWWHNLALRQKPILVLRNHSMCLLFPIVFSVPPCE